MLSWGVFDNDGAYLFRKCWVVYDRKSNLLCGIVWERHSSGFRESHKLDYAYHHPPQNILRNIHKVRASFFDDHIGRKMDLKRQ